MGVCSTTGGFGVKMVVVVMLTTDGLMCSAKSAKLSGAPRASAMSDCDTIKAMDSAVNQNRRNGSAPARAAVRA